METRYTHGVRITWKLDEMVVLMGFRGRDCDLRRQMKLAL
jgi:hypothetical protein